MKAKQVSFRYAIGLFLVVIMVVSVNLPAVQAQESMDSRLFQPQPPTPKYAMVVVGANTSDAESMHIAFRNTGNRVYNALITKGYTAANILYLSWDFGINPRVDAFATKVNIQWGLQTWLKGNLCNGIPDENVVIYFIDHGGTNYYGYFFVASDYFVYDFEISSWINAALTEWDNTSINHNFANIVFETCFSGNLLVPPPTGITGPQRIVVTATNSWLQAYSWWAPPVEWYDNRPVDSSGEAIFSYYFVKRILAGDHVQQAFNTAYTQTINEVARLAAITGTNEQQIPLISNQYGVGYW